MLWLLGGAAAIIAGASTARSGGIGRYRAAATANGYPTVVSALRSWLPRGGSERARIGNSQYVLINDPTSPREYVFHENVPPGGHMSVTPDGTATIYNKDGQPVGTIAKPWAYDSLGHPQKTWYTVDNNGNLVQHIDPESNALYPILADPPDPSARLKQAQQQQAAAAQGHPAHQPGTGTPLNKSPNADPPPPPPATPPPANKPDYNGDPHSQATTHSGLPPSQTASNPDWSTATQSPKQPPAYTTPSTSADTSSSSSSSGTGNSYILPATVGPAYDQSPEAQLQRAAAEQSRHREEILRSIPPERDLTPDEDRIYKRLRGRIPNEKTRREMLNREGTPKQGDPDPAFKGQTMAKDSEADHLITLRRLVQTRGFAQLSNKQQDAIADQVDNIVPSSKPENGSRGGKLYHE